MQRSSGVSHGSNTSGMTLGYQFWWEEPLTRVQCIGGVQGHAGVSWGQPEVKVLRNALRPPNWVGRTLDQSILHYWVKGHAGVSRNQPEVKLLNALWPPNVANAALDHMMLQVL